MMRKIILLALALCSLAAAPAKAATCFAVSTGVQITPANSSMWANASGGTPGTCAGTGGVPSTSADIATFDASSGNYTLNWGGTWNVGQIQMTGGSVDNSVNNNNITSSIWNLGTGSGLRSINCGTGTMTLTGNSGTLITAGGTNITVACGSAGFVTSGSAINNISLTISVGSWGDFTLGPTSGQSGQTSISGTFTMRSLAIQVPQRIAFGSGNTLTVTNAVSWNAGGSGGQTLFDVTSGSPSTIALTNGGTGKLISLRSITVTGGGFTCTNCAVSNVSGVTQNFPATGGGGCIINGSLRDMPRDINDNFPAWFERAS